ncbi:PBP1A family penicillin-binding protein [Synechococcus sp. CBW1002]|uniref:transglycosylase domain-containing protein n=1 Tax=unclassified Synechococcus TaxID=2626047 RepID=UPI0018CEF564|nr:MULTISPECIES: PBP1A family penicillin-binding protein [unclassified Synechococcus]QPN58499.1 PBP1A family penicillin-binding protein [Synechococcus sp. CBW1002]QPN65231.1 PBP1A family penicillin-binding protein [Synechococcus sp. CBW1006]
MKRRRRHWVLVGATAGFIGIGVALSQAVITQALDATLPDARGIARFNRPGTLTLLSSDGQVIQKLGPATREKIAPGQMPELVKQAFVAAEDRRFFEHKGVDLWGIGRAVVTNLRQGSVREGASTITQQLARMVFLSQDRTITRKLKEATLAYKLERQLSKEQILEQYLNFVYLGSSAYGVADAAWVYFSKQPDQLTLPEAALIAGLPPAPSVYSPLVNPDLALERRSIVLDRMQQAGFITAGEAAAARLAPLDLKPATPKYFNSAAPYFSSWVAQQLPTLLTPEQLEVGGLQIRTSLNLAWQNEGRQVVKQFAPNGTEGALVSIEPGTGLVRVMVGGKDFNTSQFNRATQALRSPGSTFKLFPYAAAIEAGVKPEDIFNDSPRCWGGYCPKNFGSKYFGRISLADALKNSLNTVAVQLQEKLGFDPIITMANKLGIGTTRPLGKFYPMAIGAYEQTILDMAAAYAAVANRGVYVKPVAFEEIRGPGGEVIWSRRVDGDRGRRAVDSDVADAMNWMLQRVVQGGTGAAARLDDRPVAGKTGTSEGARDLWFIGSIPQLTTAVWFGHDNNRDTKSNSGEAAWAWGRFMTKIKGQFPVQNFPPKPVLKRSFKKPGSKAQPPKQAQQPREVPYRGYEVDPDPSIWDPKPETTAPEPAPRQAPPPRDVAPAGGPPVDEYFRPLPVQ